jgi:DNA helicase-2/ATP-dependent DNA helicase PcrA
LDSESAIEEERRLMYVAMTRARTHLSITYRKRHHRDALEPSRFLKEMSK